MYKLLASALVLFVASAVVVSSACAQDKKGGEKPKFSIEDIFKRLDTDKNGFLSRVEVLASPRLGDDAAKERAGKIYDQIEKKDPKGLNLDEFKTYMSKLREGQGGGRRGKNKKA